VGKSKEHKVTIREHPGAREVRVGGSPESVRKNSDTKTPCWQFSRIDERHPDWGWKNLEPTDWREVLSHLRSFEGMTWGALLATSGGRTHGNNHHSLPVTSLVVDAQNRLADMGFVELDEIFSLRITNTLRVYGIREDRILRIIWRDPHHGNKRGCYPCK
jgi:hypothetical protein